MTLSPSQRNWAIGGGIGALALIVGYGLFRQKETGRTQPLHGHGHRHKRGEFDGGEYDPRAPVHDRGEYLHERSAREHAHEHVRGKHVHARGAYGSHRHHRHHDEGDRG